MSDVLTRLLGAAAAERGGAAAARERLLAAARDPQDAATLALAGVIGGSWDSHGRRVLPIAGLDAAATARLFADFFPRAAEAPDWRRLAGAPFASERDEEFGDLVSLLLAHASRPGERALWVAHAVAAASMADNHLWQDMGLPSRTVLSRLIGEWFAPLAAKNAGDMKWKKFFYRQLCLREDILICKSPSCGICVDYAKCFGPEEG